MLPRLHDLLEQKAMPAVLHRQYAAGGGGFRDASLHGAFPAEGVLRLRLTLPRLYGAAGAVLRLFPDGGAYTDLVFSPAETDSEHDLYELSLSLTLLGGKQACGLYYYELLLLRGDDTLFSDTHDQVSLAWTSHTAEKFRLLLYVPSFDTPKWLRGGVMYHIFVDRFYCGKGKTEQRDDILLHRSWRGELPVYLPACDGMPPNRDFFGGNLWGIIEKLPYLVSLGVTVLYLSPIFRAYSNHKYDTGDYETVDGMFGGVEALEKLLCEADKCGISVILDGVFNHSGDDSRYFNRYGRYPDTGAYQSESSEYYSWYTFRRYPVDYESWWGIQTLPRLNQTEQRCRRYFTGKRGIVARYPGMGTAGWRLDVADELPDVFLEEARSVLKEMTGGRGVLIGEVWENAADKMAYGKRRSYFQGRQLDSVMNYPFRSAVLRLLLHGDAEGFAAVLTGIYVSYPKCVCDVLMNVLGTHDTARILTVLGSGREQLPVGTEAAEMKLSARERERGLARLRIAAAIQYTVYGIPSLYYGDEAGMEGCQDPFCRMPFPWGEEDRELVGYYRSLGELRRREAVLREGSFRVLYAGSACAVYLREGGGVSLAVLINCGEKSKEISLDGTWREMLGDGTYRTRIRIPPERALILKRSERKPASGS